jgi:hypothetical protein
MAWEKWGHIGEPTTAPVLSPARGPPACEEAFDQTPLFDPLAPAPEPAFEFDQCATRRSPSSACRVWLLTSLTQVRPTLSASAGYLLAPVYLTRP